MDTKKITLNGMIWEVISTDVIGKTILSGKNWEPHLMMFMERFLRSGDICIDIGACFGWHTLQMARIVGEKGFVYAFEPQEDNFNLLTLNTYNNNYIDRIKLYNYALGHKEMNTCICSAYLPGKENYGDGFISPSMENVNIDEKEFIGRIGMSKALPLNKEKIKCVRLESINLEGPIRFIKIDVQGFEKMVLDGAKNLIMNDKPVMVIEVENPCMYQYGYSSRELFDSIRALDYYIYLLDYEYPCDHVCVPNNMLDEFEKMFEGCIEPHRENNPLTNNVECGITKKIIVR